MIVFTGSFSMRSFSVWCIFVVLCFLCFFSSRRRHTRYWRDWSSDVCSSDLTGGNGQRQRQDRVVVLAREPQLRPAGDQEREARAGGQEVGEERRRVEQVLEVVQQIGRESCRERGEISVVAGSLKKKKEARDI